jgi:hypothetical protein
MSNSQYEATLYAVARLDHAMKLLLAPDDLNLRAPRWTSELTNCVVDAMKACRWFHATGFDPPSQFGFWLRTLLHEADVGTSRGGDAGTAAWLAADAVDQLKGEWRPE